METKDKIILVTGATGNQGGAVAAHLLEDGWKVRAMTRNPDKAEARRLREMGAEVVFGDLDKPSTLQPILKGVYGVFSVQTPREFGVDAEVTQGDALANAAKEAGVRHFVYTSVGSADEKTGIPFFDSKRQIEEYLMELGMPWTIIRPVYFMENFNVPEIKDSIYNGNLSLALDSDIPLQMIAVDDIGAFAAMVFKNPETYIGRAVDIAGDELTGPEMAELLTRAVGRQVTYKQMSIDNVRTFGADYAMMWDWFNLRGYDADIPHLREVLPSLKTFESWVARSGWHKAAA